MVLGPSPEALQMLSCVWNSFLNLLLLRLIRLWHVMLPRWTPLAAAAAAAAADGDANENGSPHHSHGNDQGFKVHWNKEKLLFFNKRIISQDHMIKVTRNLGCLILSTHSTPHVCHRHHLLASARHYTSFSRENTTITQDWTMWELTFYCRETTASSSLSIWLTELRRQSFHLEKA